MSCEGNVTNPQSPDCSELFRESRKYIDGNDDSGSEDDDDRR